MEDIGTHQRFSDGTRSRPPMAHCLDWRFATPPKTPIENCGKTNVRKGIVCMEGLDNFFENMEYGHSQGL